MVNNTRCTRWRWAVLLSSWLLCHCGCVSVVAHGNGETFNLVAACRPTCGPSLHNLTAVYVPSNDALTAVVALTHTPQVDAPTSSGDGPPLALCIRLMSTDASFGLTWKPVYPGSISRWCTWAVFDTAPNQVAIASPMLLNTSSAWLQVASCSTEACGEGGGELIAQDLHVGGYTGNTTSWIAAEGLMQAAWNPLTMDEHVDTQAKSAAATAVVESAAAATTVATAAAVVEPSSPLYVLPSLVEDTQAIAPGNTVEAAHQNVSGIQQQQQQQEEIVASTQQQQQQQQVAQAAAMASPAAQQGPTRDLGPPGTETNVEFMSRLMRIGLPVLGAVLALALLATLTYLLCVRYPNNWCTKLCCRNMTSPVQPVQEEPHRQPRHSILMMYTNRLAASLRISSRRSSSQTQPRHSEKDPVIQRELLHRPSLSAQAGGWGQNSLRSRRGSAELLVFGDAGGGGVEGDVSTTELSTPPAGTFIIPMV